MEAKGVAVLQRGIGDGTSEGSSPAEAGYRESTLLISSNEVNTQKKTVY